MVKFNPETLKLLTVLKQNNQRDWFSALNKKSKNQIQ